jgi:catechol 2,3-dioxygenase-like lactoylglutathione lyase family enzyme
LALKIATFALLVDDYDRGIAWFRDVLGLALAEDTALSGGKRWVVMTGAGGARMLLARAEDDQRTAIGRQAGGRVGFFLETTDFDADYARLRVAGVRFLEAPRHESYGNVVVFEDIFGNKWDLIQPAPAGP